METSAQVVERELREWREQQQNPRAMNGESPEETDARLAFMDEMRVMERRYYDEAKEAARRNWQETTRMYRDFDDRLRALKLRRYEVWHVNATDYTAYRFPRITWLDLWRAIWGGNQ